MSVIFIFFKTALKRLAYEEQLTPIVPFEEIRRETVYIVLQ